jgi:transcriptional regulator GlxA family with amidase domain
LTPRAGSLQRTDILAPYRHELGYSVLHEIRRVRTNRIAQLLVETQMPVCEIADALGFADIQHFARYFRSAKKKISLLAYRKSRGGR